MVKGKGWEREGKGKKNEFRIGNCIRLEWVFFPFL